MSLTEENYLKALIYLSSLAPGLKEKKEVGTNELASYLKLKSSTVNEMLKRLKEKRLINHEKYKKISLTNSGERTGLKIVRKHRLWETFLFTKLDFDWIEIHEVAEQLEHIKSEKLVEKIDKLLGYPNYDPHGDPIPDKHGNIPQRITKSLFAVERGKKCIVMAVCDTSRSFLNYLEELGISIKTEIAVIGKIDYDNSIKIKIRNELYSISSKVADNLLVDDNFN
tara:strand:- start:189 stop:863 length:675 start_codon:yes stop_codon:yes gene_type:complete